MLMQSVRSRLCTAAAIGSLATVPIESFCPPQRRSSANPHGMIPPFPKPGKTSFSRTFSLDASTTDIAAIDIGLSELQDFLKTAETAARAAGSIIVANSGCCSKPTSSEGAEMKYSIKDVVTKYDREAQTAIYETIQSAYPSHEFLGEEDVGAGSSASADALEAALVKSESNILWICDPIDGTANFAVGLPISGVTLTVVYGGQAVAGVLYDPHRDEIFTAIRGHGGHVQLRNGDRRPLAVSSTSSAKSAIVNAGCPADPNAFSCSIRGVSALNSETRGIRMMACSALTLAWLAAGRLDAHFGYDLSSWDLAAGALLIQEAGGRVTDIDGSEYRLTTRSMLCSNGIVHDELLHILKEADAVSFTRAE